MSPSQKSQSEYVKPGFLHRLFFTWWLGLLKLVAQRPLKQEDLYPLPDEYKAENLVPRLEEAWSQELNNANRENRRPKLWKAILRVLPLKSYLKLAILGLTEVFTSYAVIFFLWLFFEYLQGESHMEKWHPPVIVLGIGICSYLRVFAFRHSLYVTLNIGMQLKVAVMGIVYKTILSMTDSGIKRATSGVIMNLISNDAQRMEELISCCFLSVSCLLSLITGILLLWALVGWQSLSGTLVLVLFVIFQTGLLNAYGKLRYKQKQATDHRLAAIKDVISGIRAVKMHALEWKFSDRIMSLRRKEINLLRLLGAFSALPSSQIFTLPLLATLVSIATLIYSSVQTNIVNVFTIVLLYNILGMEVAFSCNYDFIELVHSFTSIKRFQEFLMILSDSWDHQTKEDNKSFLSKPSVMKYLNFFSERIAQKQSSTSAKYSLLTNDQRYNSKVEAQNDAIESIAPNVTIKKMSAGWFEDDEQCTLHDISFSTEPNQLLMVTGPVGSGKSTLLMAILREIPIKSGNISTNGKIAYVSQYPSIFTGTVRDNILFGQKFDKHRYQRALDVCDLNEDISRFPKGDMSLTGQRGVTLSGGQRVRVSLARAVYSNADVYLLDDPLSALDVKVGKKVLNECICNHLSSRLRILVTHQLQHLHRADKILLMKEGRLMAQGSHKQLISEGLIGDVLEYDSKSDNLKENEEDELNVKYKTLLENSRRDVEEEDEDRQLGTVTWQVYWKYLRSGLHPVLLTCFALFYFTVQGSILAPQLWLSRIVKLPKHQQKGFASLGILAILVTVAFVLCYSRELWFYNILVNASKNLHDKMTLTALKAPVLFFDTNPLGRIINRFSKDIGCMDNLMPGNFLFATALCTTAVGVVVLSLITNIWIIFAVVPLCFLLFCICYYYLRVIRDLKRMESIHCSPIYAHAAETIAGLAVVRTSHMQENFLEIMFS